MRYLLIIIALFIAVLAALFTVPVKDGKPVLDWQHAQQNWQEPDKLLEQASSSLDSKQGETDMYRWRDARGNWQYGQIPPPGVEAERVTVKAPSTISAEEVRGGKGLEQQQQQ
ncbi:MAG: DUF4124 domain-containing protein [Pseudomonadales bacterium]|nr:DUF4124 domain-containing protein [Pseudomonadales bacterium]